MYELQELIARHASRGLLLDTNLLLLYAIGLYERDYIAKFKRTRQYDPEDFDWLRQFTAPFHRVITTPHILAELSNLAVDKRNGKAAPYLSVLLELIRLAKELYVEKDVIVGTDYLPTLGVTDAAIVELARRKSYLVVTDDFPLTGYLQFFNCDVINLNHIRTARWSLGE